MAPTLNSSPEHSLQNGAPRRAKATGLNSNVSVQGTQFHVQTEDLWPTSAQIASHVFAADGRVVQVTHIDYARHLEKPNFLQILPKAMLLHHASVVSRLNRGNIGEVEAEGEPTPGRIPEQKLASAPDLRKPLTTIAELPIDEEPAVEDDRKSGTFKVAPQAVWDRLVAQAHRDRRGPEAVPESPREAPRATSDESTRQHQAAPTEIALASRTQWDLAVEARRQRRSALEAERAAAERQLEPAAQAYEAGLEQMSQPDKTQALVHFARAVQLDPHNGRYRSSLRHALDWLDRFERLAR